jgi:methionyl-tRNA formyltransferase
VSVIRKIKLSFNRIILIGGGDLLFYTATALKKKQINFFVLLSRRHSIEKYNNIYFKDLLKKNKIKYKILKNINLDKKVKEVVKPRSIALCFGPSWIFDKKILTIFGYSMYNINLIPLPKYMGGAHFTWQILNNNLEGGIYFQQITDKLDQGPILLEKKFKIKSKINLKPSNYFYENLKYGKKFIDILIEKIINNNHFIMKSFKKKYLFREYFPRLLTKYNAFINWNWSTKEIIDFCNSFDKPYAGAMTFYKNKKIFLNNVSLFKKQKFHPFASGIIIKIVKLSIYVATKEGIIKIERCLNSGKSINQNMRQGQRLITPYKFLDSGLSYMPKLN